MKSFPIFLTALLLPATAFAQLQWGRDLEDRKTFSIGLTFGSVFGLDGEVQETTRPIEQVGGRTSGAPPENYSWRELGFDEQFATLGLSLEKEWRLFTLQSHFLYGNPSVSGTADRDFFIGVDRVTFRGRDFEYMVIPEGQRLSGDLDIYAFDLRFLFTPVSFGDAYGPSFTPWGHLGLFAFMADYTVDAGPAQRVIQYENPPRDYVVGGRGSGRTGLVVPELGLGGKARLPISDRLDLHLQAYAAFLRYDGSSRDFGVSSRNEKAVNVDYTNLGARALLEWDLSDRVGAFAGVEFQHWRGEADIRATDRPREEILALREKFDKEVTFEMSSLVAVAGLRF